MMVQVFSIIFAVLFFILAISTPNNAYQSVYGSITASFVFLVTLEALLALKRFLEKYKFRKFFGRSAAQNQMYLVYPDFVLAEEVIRLVTDNRIGQQLIYTKKNLHFNVTHRIDIISCAAVNDIQAIIEIAALFGEFTKQTPPIRVDDEAIKQSQDSFISFGFSSNHCTHMYLNRSHNPLFKIVTDLPNPRFAEYVTVTDDSGKQIECKSSQEIQFGLILRYRPDPDNYPHKVWFICAGIGPDATVGAAWYLKTCWRNLHRATKKNDFIAILRVHAAFPRESDMVFLRTPEHVILNALI